MTSPGLQEGSLDRWLSDGPVDEARGRELAEFVELRAASPDEVATRRAYLDLIDPRPGERVIDVGCGTGVVTRDLARRVLPGGRVVGVDPNAFLLQQARLLADKEGLSAAIDWRSGDARDLAPEPPGYDLVVCATVLAHIQHSEPLVERIVRLARPGGRVAIFEIDPESLLLCHPDRHLTRRVLNAANDYGFANAWVSRSVPGLMLAAGVRELQVRAFTSLERDPSGFLARSAELRPVIAERAGAITAEEGQRWLAQLRAEMDAGRFLAGITYVFAWGRLPVS